MADIGSTARTYKTGVINQNVFAVLLTALSSLFDENLKLFKISSRSTEANIATKLHSNRVTDGHICYSFKKNCLICSIVLPFDLK